MNILSNNNFRNMASINMDKKEALRNKYAGRSISHVVYL